MLSGHFGSQGTQAAAPKVETAANPAERAGRSRARLRSCIEGPRWGDTTSWDLWWMNPPGLRRLDFRLRMTILPSRPLRCWRRGGAASDSLVAVFGHSVVAVNPAGPGPRVSANGHERMSSPFLHAIRRNDDPGGSPAFQAVRGQRRAHRNSAAGPGLKI
jgi:hypothetical protein